MINVILPDWPVPSHIRALTTTRIGGVSSGAYTSLNLATHVADQPAAVLSNRRRLRTQLHLPSEPCWLQQVHGTTVVTADHYLQPPPADAVYSMQADTVCAILTADCLPLLICDQQGTQIAAIHAGWRGLAAGIIAQTLAKFSQPMHNLLVWLGPAIGPRAFEVGHEVYTRFVSNHKDFAQAFMPSLRPTHWYAEIYRLATLALGKQGVTQIYGGSHCTYSEPNLFYSYRRDGEKTGRMASLIWMAS